ncbi:UV radiation resistance-associated gene protein [Lepeophtheirus salmonis]|uniref:UV radiation resistance-associated gene protein n=1 Tax=Lepeophtheirus salmonis TaxID=72036 RepID=UPI001AE37F0E|nr:UV radiation resistance-associated gene protein-like [Lepeophtheirus salmonis]
MMMESMRHTGFMSKKPWFPPGTFQLRVRSISSLVFYNHEVVEDEGEVWISDENEKLLWSLCLKKKQDDPLILKIPHESILHSDTCFRISFRSGSSCQTWVVSDLKSLPSLGTSLPEGIAENEPLCFLGILGGNFLSLVPKGNAPTLKVLDFLTPISVSSYSLSLLLKLRRHQRALYQREADNQSLKQELADQGLDPHNTKILDPDSSLSLHQRIFISDPSKKTPFERKSQLLISSKIEYLKCQLDLLRSEKKRLSDKNTLVKKEIDLLTEGIRKKRDVIKKLSGDTDSLKSSLNVWSKTCQKSAEDFQLLDSHIKETRLHLVNSINDLFPISIDSNIPTIRWVSLPNLSSLSRPFLKQDTLNVVSIVLGWIAHLVLLISRCLDIPLKYPIKASGSVFAIRDDVCRIQEEDLRDFPLSARSVDLSRCEYGIYLLNKNICYLRWSCGLPPGDVRKILHNVVDLYKLSFKSSSFKPLDGAELESLSKYIVLRPPWLMNRKFNNNNNMLLDYNA